MTAEPTANIKSAYPWKLLLFLVGLMIACFACLFWLMSFPQTYWKNHHRELVVERVTEINDLRIVTFANSDSILIFRHAPHGWFAPPLQMRKLSYGWTSSNERMGFVYTMGQPGKPDKEFDGFNDDILIGKKQIEQVLLVLHPQTSGINEIPIGGL